MNRLALGLRNLALALLVFLSAVFLALVAAPQSPYRVGSTAGPAAVEAYRPGDPLYLQYAGFLWQAVSLRMGPAADGTDRPVGHEVWRASLFSLLLAGVALALGVAFAFLLHASAWRSARPGLADRVLRIAFSAGLILPPAVSAGLAIGVGLLSPWPLPLALYAGPLHLALPASVLALGQQCLILQLGRQPGEPGQPAGGRLAALSAGARAVLPALMRLDEVVAPSLAGLLVVEVAFELPGAGRLMADAIVRNDPATAAWCAACLGSLLIAASRIGRLTIRSAEGVLRS